MLGHKCIKGEKMCKKRKKDYRPFKEKFWDLFYNKPWKMILYTFLGSVALLIISILTNNLGGINCIILYPVSLPFYGFALDIHKKQLKFPRAGMATPFVLCLWFSPLVCFILDLLGVKF